MLQTQTNVVVLVDVLDLFQNLLLIMFKKMDYQLNGKSPINHGLEMHLVVLKPYNQITLIKVKLFHTKMFSLMDMLN